MTSWEGNFECGVAEPLVGLASCDPTPREMLDRSVRLVSTVGLAASADSFLCMHQTQVGHCKLHGSRHNHTLQCHKCQTTGTECMSFNAQDHPFACSCETFCKCLVSRR